MSRVGRLIRGTGILTIAALALSACGGSGFDQSAATRVLQSVDVSLDPAGAITDVASNAVYHDELSGSSTDDTESFPVEDVVDDLPVRVSTQYTTGEDSGSNLDDLEGHTGRVEIAVTVENLTLNSSELTYDVAGELRQSSALVGTPLSVAGSVELDDTTASKVIVDVESESTTNGVISQSSEGNAVVQWGTVLAPPQSEATTTFRLVADVEDFSTPEFDLAVQTGFHTDMSFDGMLTSAFDTSSGSEYAMQQKGIELVADVNEVLTRAGTTITEIRQNLDHTTDTLGVDAAQQLRQNSDDMVNEMQRVGEQLTALESQVDGSLTGAEAAMNSQLSQIVASMSGMMGDTDATPPRLVTGQGCAATVEDAESNGSLYSTFLILGAQLEGYAEANAECRDEIVAGIQDTLGPEVPDVETCTVDGDNTSITCALYDAQNSVLSSLGELVAQGDEIITNLTTEPVEDAMTDSETLETTLGELKERIGDLDAGLQNDEKDENVKALEEKLEETAEIYEELSEAHGTLENSHARVTESARAAIQELNGDKPQSQMSQIQRQQEELAVELCTLKTEVPEAPETDGSEDSVPMTELIPADVLAQNEKIEELRAELVDVECDGTPKDESELPWGGTLVSKVDALSTEQTALWQSVIDELSSHDDMEMPAALETIGQELANLKNNIDVLDAGIGEVETGVTGSFEELRRIVSDISDLQDRATDRQIAIGKALETLETHQNEDLPAEIRAAFREAALQTSEELPAEIDQQVRIVTDRINNAQEAVINSYNTTIGGLATTSDVVVNETAEQIDGQKETLENQQGETAEALSSSTTAVLESIHQSTTSSTRDLEGASAQLGTSLNNVILDLGDPEIQGSGILGSMSASSAMSDTADYQLALASQRAAGYANVRSEDIAEIMLRQAQFSASLEAAGTLPAFHLDVPAGARSQTIYAFHIGGSK